MTEGACQQAGPAAAADGFGSLETFRYPKAVKQLIRGIVDAMVEALHPMSVLLLGSAGRGELSYRAIGDGGVELFSDFEFLVVLQGRVTGRHRKQIEGIIQTWEERAQQKNGLFHIDVLIRSHSRLKRMPAIIFTYELSKASLLLHGSNVCGDVPPVSVNNLDFGNTREIIYKRLWTVLQQFPEALIRGELGVPESRAFGYVLCRNALDLTTVFLPQESILLPSYEERVRYIEEHFGTMRKLHAFGPEFPEFLARCLGQRKALDFESMDLREYYREVIEHLCRGIEMLLPEERQILELPEYSKRIFNEWPISRGEWLNLARLWGYLARKEGPGSAFRWLGAPKKGWLTVGMVWAHRAVLAEMTGTREEARAACLKSGDALSKIWRRPTIEGTDFLDDWTKLREAWGVFWQQYIRLGSRIERSRMPSTKVAGSD